MRAFFVFVVLFLLAVAIVNAEVEDARLRHILERAVRYEDNPHASWSEVRYAIQEAGGNSNRVVSLMKQMVGDGGSDDGSSAFYILEIGKYGTISDLPFLYQRISTTNFCEVATMSALRIEGLTTNSLMQVKTRLPQRRDAAWGTMCSWSWLLQTARKMPAASPVRTLAVSNAVEFAARETEYPSSFDKSIRLTDPTYTMSKRRLAVMRSVRDLGVNEWQTNFVTQAIRELEAYPEANLPE